MFAYKILRSVSVERYGSNRARLDGVGGCGAKGSWSRDWESGFRGWGKRENLSTLGAGWWMQGLDTKNEGLRMRGEGFGVRVGRRNRAWMRRCVKLGLEFEKSNRKMLSVRKRNYIHVYTYIYIYIYSYIYICIGIYM